MSVLDLTRPRVCSVPEYVSSAGAEAVELAEMAGLVLDPWEAFVLENALGEKADGKWAAFEVGLVVSRQNGKGAILEARELAGLFLLGERLIIHSAHQFDTSLEAFRRLLTLVEETPDFYNRVKRVSKSHGEEGIELKNGQRIRFRTRTKGGGRGFTGDCLILDEAMILPEFSHGALLPTLSARPNPQVWYTGSAVDQYTHEHGVVLSRVRSRGRKGDKDLAYFEWSVERETDDGKPFTPEKVDEELAADAEAWAEANPALGIRITPEHIEKERQSMDARTFAVERLGVGDWPPTDGSAATVIQIDQWNSLVDVDSAMVDPVCLSFDVAPDRSSASICAAGLREDGIAHVEVIDHRAGTNWVVIRLGELAERHKLAGVYCDAAGPAASLIHEVDLEVTAVSAKDHALACGHIFDAVANSELRHLGTAELRSAIKGAARRPLGDSWAWARKTSSVDISPLVGATLALWGASTLEPNPEPWAAF